MMNGHCHHHDHQRRFILLTVLLALRRARAYLRQLAGFSSAYDEQRCSRTVVILFSYAVRVDCMLVCSCLRTGAELDVLWLSCTRTK